MPVIAGAGSNSTAEAVRLAKHAAEAGADAVLIVSPYYNKPTQDGLYQHFSAVAAAVSVPVIVYDIPGRSIVQVAEDTLVRLAADYPNISGIKDATADVARPTRIRNLLGADFAQLSGEDATALPIPCCRWAWLYFGYGECCSKTCSAICTRHGQLAILPRRKPSMNG